MRIGYGRVSTHDQNPDGQHEALKAAGYERVFIDHASGTLASRHPELDNALLVARPGDELVVTKLDRLGRLLDPMHAPSAAHPCGPRHEGFGGNADRGWVCKQRFALGVGARWHFRFGRFTLSCL